MLDPLHPYKQHGYKHGGYIIIIMRISIHAARAILLLPTAKIKIDKVSRLGFLKVESQII